MSKGIDARGNAETGGGDRPRLSRQDRLQEVEARKEKALVEYIGTSHINDVLKAMARKIEAEIEAGTFDENVRSLDLGVAMTDSPLRMEAIGRHDQAKKEGKVSRDSKPTLLSSKEAQAFAISQSKAYETLLQARTDGRKNVKTKGWGSNASKAKQFDLEQQVLGMEPTPYQLEEDMESLEETPGVIELEDVLREKGLQLRIVRRGPVWKFSAEPVAAVVESVKTENEEDLFPGLTGKARDKAILEHGRQSALEEVAEAEAVAKREAGIQELRDKVDSFEQRAKDAEAREKTAHDRFLNLLTALAVRQGVDLSALEQAGTKLPNGDGR